MPDRTNKGLLGAVAVNLLVLALWASAAPALDTCWMPTENALNNNCPSQTLCVEWIGGPNAGAVECCTGEIPSTEGNCTDGCFHTQLRSALTSPEDEFLVAEGKPMAANESFEVRHAVPEIPLLIDHVVYSPEEIGLFDGVPLHFLMCRASIAESVLYAFTSRKEMFDRAKNCLITDPSMIVREVPEKGGAGIVFYEDERWNGASYFLPQGQYVVLDGTWWDDRISSLKGVGMGTMMTFYEDTPSTGSSFTLSTDLGWPDLDFFGWGDRASAVRVWSVKPTLISRQAP